MYCSFWEKCKNSPETGLGCSTPLNISGMEMSQRIHIWYQILLKITIFWENGKKKQKKEKLVKKNLGKPTKYNFELKMLKLHENHVTTNV